jgi:hypothetical protein
MPWPRKTRVRIRTALVVLISSVIIAATESSAQPRPNALRTVSVCELFNDLASYSGTRVKVRGILYSGREVFALGEKTCSKKFVTRYRSGPELPGIFEPTGEYVWPTAINLITSSESPGDLGFQTDDEAVVRVTKILTEARAIKRDKSTTTALWVTVVGVLSTKEHYDVGLNANREFTASGYGHLGAYPAQLVIETMIDPRVESPKK